MRAPAYSSFIFLLLMGFGAMAQQGSYTIRGAINADYEGPVIFIIGNDSATATVRNRTFTLSGSVNQASMAVVTIPGSFCGSGFYLENSDIQLSLRAEYRPQFKTYCAMVQKVSGSASDSIYKAFRHKKEKIAAGSANRKDPALYKTLITEFIKDNPGFVYSAALISENITAYGLPWAKDMQQLLTPGVLSTSQGVIAASLIRQQESDRPGAAFHDFDMARHDGTPFSSASLKGKYVLYDFWASWCLPCRKENANLLPLYARYKNSAFEIVSISLDDDAAKWKKAIQQDKLPWVHVSDLRAWKSPLVQEHSIKLIPYNILVDPAGTIIAVNLRGDEARQQLKALFGK